jgi:hypothetical protein
MFLTNHAMHTIGILLFIRVIYITIPHFPFLPFCSHGQRSDVGPGSNTPDSPISLFLSNPIVRLLLSSLSGLPPSLLDLAPGRA